MPRSILSHGVRLSAVALPLAVLATANAQTTPPATVAYVTNQESGTVSVIDVATATITAEFPVGRDPRGIGVTPDGRYVITANQRDGNISIVDLAHGNAVTPLAIGKSPEFVRIAPDGSLALVTYEPSSKGGPPPADAGKAAAHGDADGKGDDKAKSSKPEAESKGKGAKADDDDDQPAEIAIVDLAARKVVRRLQASKETEGMDFSPDGKTLVVANEGDDSLLTYAMPGVTLTQRVDISAYGHRPRGIKFSPDGKSVVVSLESSDRVLVLDQTLTLVKSLDTGKGPYGVTYNPDGTQLWNAAARSGQLQVWASQDYASLATIGVGKRCWHFTFTPDAAQALVSCGRSDSVFVVDAHSLKPVREIKGLHQPWGIVTYPKALGTLDRPARP
jgi:YVTN family beta-propeller protein